MSLPRSNLNAAESGIFHLCGGDAASRFELAQTAIELACGLPGGARWARVRAVKNANFSLPVHRPANAVLSRNKIALRTGIRMDAWKTQLDYFLKQTDVVNRLASGE